MTTFVGVSDLVHWVARAGAERIMAEDVSQTIEADFHRWE